MAVDVRTSRLVRNVAIVAGGLVTSILVMGVNTLFSRRGLDVFSISFAFLIPAGAILGGAAASSGYYLVARWTHTMPERRILGACVAVAVGTWFGYLLLDYGSLRFPDGSLVSRNYSFPGYMALRAEHLQLVVRVRGIPVESTGELGPLGYVYLLLELAGFCAGGFLVYGLLRMSLTCPTCRMYVRTRQICGGVVPRGMHRVVRRAEVDIPSLDDQIRAAHAGRPQGGYVVDELRCPGCRESWIRMMLPRSQNVGRAPFDAGMHHATEEQVLRIRKAVSDWEREAVPPRGPPGIVSER